MFRVVVFAADINFYPRPPRGGRPPSTDGDHTHPQFLSTPSARRATARPASGGSVFPHFYPRPPRGGRPPASERGHGRGEISIHALREEGDLHRRFKKMPKIFQFLSTPSARRATEGQIQADTTDTFLSTPSARRATAAGTAGRWPRRHFYPRPPRGGRRAEQEAEPVHRQISIHALREEGDQHNTTTHNDTLHFYPRPPRGGRHNGFGSNNYYLNFYPRPPRGGRPGQEEQK